MDPNASTGRDDDRNRAVRSRGSMRLSSASVLLSPPLRGSAEQGDSRGRVSRLRAHGEDDDDVTLQSAISQSGERSVLMPREDTGITSYDLPHEGLNAGSGTETVTEEESGRRPSPHSPQDKKAGSRLELASPREADEDMFVSHEVSGSNPPLTQAVAPQAREQRSMPPFGEKQTNHHLELAPAREQGPEDLTGRPGAVMPAATTVEEQQHDGANQHDTILQSQRIAPTPLVEGEQQEFMVEGGEHLTQPGAYPVDGVHARHVAEEDTIWGGVDSGNEDGVVGDDNHDEDLFSAQLVDPEADRLQLQREFQMQVRREVERIAQQDSDKACCIVAGVNCSKRTNQAFCILVLALAVSSLLAALFATDVVGPQSSTPAVTSPSMSNPPIGAGIDPSAQPSRSPIESMTPSLQPPTKLPTFAPTPSAMPNATPPNPAPMLNPTPFPSPLPVTPAPTFAPGHVAQWVQVGNNTDGENSGDQSGWSVALSSNGAVLAIGAPLNDGGASDAGHVRVYTNAGGGWERRGSDLDGSAAGDWFGWSVSLSADGTILAVGARLADGVNGVDSGHVRVFQWISNTWQNLGSTLDGAGDGDQFGNSLALSDDGTILAVGAWGNDAGGSNAGHVRVFTRADSDWTKRGNDLLGSSPGDQFGDSVSLSSDGSVLACGADQEGNGGPGYVIMYRWSGSAWQQQGSTLTGFSANDVFGESLSLSGDGSVVAVGARLGNYAMVFQSDGNDWVQIGQTIREASGDNFGNSLSLSFDGKTILIGGPWNDSNGSNSGHALVFRLSRNEESRNEEWIQVGQELVGEAAFDWFGWSTSISGGGTRISIGAYLNDGNGDNAGHVRVYDLQ